MTHVKWLRAITAVAEPFTGWQHVAYHGAGPRTSRARR
jgi:DMSO/TMAO reductase YedYZ molybdopterin-dependent catalytic subunit